MVFDWRDPDRLDVCAYMSGSREGWEIREIPRLLHMVRYSYEIEGDLELLNTEVSGDWIFRMGGPAEQLVRPLEACLQRAIRRRLILTLRRVEREVVIARGRYQPSALPGDADRVIEVFAREPAKDEGRGNSDFPHFLECTAEWLGRPIVDEVESPPDARVRWRYNLREDPTKLPRRDDRDVTLVLTRLHEQIGLTFTREKRPVQILSVERAPVFR
jgi:hypothetical protein